MRKRWWNPRIFPETREGSEIDWLAGAGIDMLTRCKDKIQPIQWAPNKELGLGLKKLDCTKQMARTRNFN